MAYDKSPTRDGVIVGFGIATAVALIALIPVFHSYFSYMSEQQLQQSVANAPRPDLESYRSEQQRVLSGSAVSVEEAMSQLAQRGRAASPVVEPRRAEQADVDAVEGWNRLPNATGAEAARRAWEQGRQAAPAPAPEAPTAPEGQP